MSYSISYMYEIVDRFSAPLEKIRRAAVRSSTEIIKQTDRIAASLAGVSSAANRTKKVVDNLSSLKASLAQTTLEAERMRREMEKQIKIPPMPAMPRMPGLPFARGAALAGGAHGGTRGGDAGLGGMVQAAAGVTFPAMFLKGAFNASANLEASLSNIARLTDLDSTGLQRFKQEAEKTAIFLGVSTKATLDMAAGGSQAGIATEELTRFTKLAGMTATAAGFGFSEAGEIIGQMKGQLGLAIPDLERLMDQVNFISDKSATSPSKMLNVLTRSSGILRNYSVETQTALAGFFSNVEPMPDVAATALNAVGQILTTAGGKIGEVSRKDLAAGLDMYLDKVSKLDSLTAKKELLKTFGKEYGDTVEKLLGRRKEIAEMLGFSGSDKAVGSQIKEFAARQKTMQAKLERFSARWEDLQAKIFGTEVGGKFLDFINYAILKLGDFIDKNPEISRFAIGVFAFVAAFSALALVIGLVSWPAVAIAGISAGLKYAWDNSEKFRESVGRVWESAKKLFDELSDEKTNAGRFFKQLAEFGSGTLISGVYALANSLNLVVESLRAIVAVSNGDFQKAIDIIKGSFGGVSGESVVDYYKGILSHTPQAFALEKTKEFWGFAGDTLKNFTADGFHGGAPTPDWALANAARDQRIDVNGRVGVDVTTPAGVSATVTPPDFSVGGNRSGAQ